jgi:hypothetical protein
MNNNLCIIRGGYSYCWFTFRYRLRSFKWISLRTRHLSELGWDSRIGWATVPGAPKLLITAPIVLLYESSEIPVTLMAGQDAILVSGSLLKLTLLSLHSASSQTLLEAPSDYNTFCWWSKQFIWFVALRPQDGESISQQEMIQCFSGWRQVRIATLNRQRDTFLHGRSVFFSLRMLNRPLKGFVPWFRLWQQGRWVRLLV